MFIKSIRWRLQWWLAFLLACILSGFGVTAYQLHRTNRLKEIDGALEQRVSVLNADVRGPPPFGRPMGPPPFGGPFPPPPGPDFQKGNDFPRRPPRHWMEDLAEKREIRLSARATSLFEPMETNGFYYAVWSRGGHVLKRSTNAPADLLRPARGDAGTGIHTRTRALCREAFQFTEMGDCVLAGRSITGDLKSLRWFAWWLTAAGGTVLVCGLGGGWWLTSRAIRPVEQISAAATRISAGHLSERINVADTDSELGRLAGVLNSTFARLEAAFAQQKQFTADASHELRTPLAVMIAEAQATLARERDPAEYRKAVEVCLEAAQQMRRLTQSLLQLARFDAGQERMERRPVDLAEVARATVERLKPLAKERGIQIVCELQLARVLGDPERLEEVMLNLLTNALDYNRPGGEIRVSTRAENHIAMLAVADTGIGIDAKDLPHLFKRFDRADPARARACGHSGLGLAICRAILEAHGGTIQATSQPGQGSVFRVELPGE